MNRKCRYVPLSKQPLVLVLCQVRYSSIRTMADYIPTIQERFRRNKYPLERSGKVQQVVITPKGVTQSEQDRWEYRTRDETSSIIILQDSVVLQTTAYTRFEEFADDLNFALTTVLSVTEHDNLGVIQRVGLRYVDVIYQDHRNYLRPGLHGVDDAVFNPGTNRLFVECMGTHRLDDKESKMIIRIAQNDQGYDLPPDLIEGAPSYVRRAEQGKLVTQIDIDHFIEYSLDPNPQIVIEKTYRLHDHIIETFHDHVITPEAVQAWK